jgi:hypothetical protein
MNHAPTTVLVVGATGGVGRLPSLGEEPTLVQEDLARLGRRPA